MHSHALTHTHMPSHALTCPHMHSHTLARTHTNSLFLSHRDTFGKVSFIGFERLIGHKFSKKMVAAVNLFGSKSVKNGF